MYYVTVVCLMFVFPWVSTVLSVKPEAFEIGALGWVLALLSLGKWYVFWAVGVRLVIAGLSQIIRPRYAAQTILGIQGEDDPFLVRELGAANVGLGCMGIFCLFSVPSIWISLVAFSGGVFYLLTGVNHILKKGARTRMENVVIGLELFTALVLLGWFMLLRVF